MTGEEAVMIGGGGGEVVHQAAARALLVAGDKLVRQAALLRGEGDDFLIVKGDAQLFGERLADLAAAAAVFTADGDNERIFHGIALLGWKTWISTGCSPLADSIIPQLCEDEEIVFHLRKEIQASEYICVFCVAVLQ